MFIPMLSLRNALLLTLTFSTLPGVLSFRGVVKNRLLHNHPCHAGVTLWHTPLIRTALFEDFNGEGQKSSERIVDLFPNRFDRWRFLQNLLEGDAPSDVVNKLIFQVLEGALKFPRLGGDGETIVMAVDYQAKINDVLDNFSSEGQIPIFIPSNSYNSDEDEESALAMLQRFEGLLPDPEEDADAYKSLWDIVMEIHGREGVKFQETKNPTLDWKLACTVTRLLIHLDFLTLGIVTSPLKK